MNIQNIEESSYRFCRSLTEYLRFPTREVSIGGIPLGGNNPVRVQSMTTADTMDTDASVQEIIRLIQVGAEYVRLTAPSIKEAKHLEVIKKELAEQGYSVPLVADIHFTPNAAEAAARVVEKVRINPGNFVDKKKFQTIEYTEEEYQSELDRIRERFTPLVDLCKERNVAMRIGTNHGSLSDRIMSRYGDTPLGMVESAMEFLRIARDLDFHDIVISMKASNPQVMVQAYRTLVNTMMKQGMDYPLHLGVTEAGDGEDGRIKSAVGIGTLLEDGLGDTIRVSLTEDSEHEIPVAKALVERYSHRVNHDRIKPFPNEDEVNLLEFRKRKSNAVGNIGGDNVPRTFIDCSTYSLRSPDTIAPLGYTYLPTLDKWGISDTAFDYLYLGDTVFDGEIHNGLKKVYNHNTWKNLPKEQQKSTFPLLTAEQYSLSEESEVSQKINFVVCSIQDFVPALLFRLHGDTSVVLILRTDNLHAMAELRRGFFELIQRNLQVPVIIKREFSNITQEQLQLYSSTDMGALLVDGFGDGLWLDFQPSDSSIQDGDSISFIRSVVFGILQATRTRISKTEYIACPSCGRTLFDLQETTAKIRSRTSHLKGVKIGIMGCIVNGPGEMADADFGYVGSGRGKITLYKGKEVVQKNIPAEEAVDALIQLIRDNGKWVEEE